MDINSIDQSFVSELHKIAVTRSVKEWRSAAGAGDQGTADQIARSSAQLGLKPRYLENISEGGMEAAVDKTMGRAGFNQPAPAQPQLQQRLDTFKSNKARIEQMPAASASRQAVAAGPQSPRARAALLQGTQTPAASPAPNASGYIAQKVYKPDSPIATGEGMSQLLQTKQQMTDTARGLSPEAKQMVPAMYGHKTIEGGGEIRHVSQHEYVPGLKQLGEGATGLEQVHNVQRQVAGPMASKGMPMRDIPRLHMEGGNIGIGGNKSNVGVSPQGPKVIDFLPEGMSSAKGQLGVVQRGADDVAYSHLGSGRTDTGYDRGNLNQLRRDVYKPQAGYQQPALPGATAPAAPAASPVSGTRPTVSARPGAMGPALKPTSVARPAPALPSAAKTIATKIEKPMAQAATAVAKPLGQIAAKAAPAVTGAVNTAAHAAAPGLKRLAMGLVR